MLQLTRCRIFNGIVLHKPGAGRRAFYSAFKPFDFDMHVSIADPIRARRLNHDPRILSKTMPIPAETVSTRLRMTCTQHCIPTDMNRPVASSNCHCRRLFQVVKIRLTKYPMETTEALSVLGTIRILPIRMIRIPTFKGRWPGTCTRKLNTTSPSTICSSMRLSFKAWKDACLTRTQKQRSMFCSRTMASCFRFAVPSVAECAWRMLKRLRTRRVIPPTHHKALC